MDFSIVTLTTIRMENFLIIKVFNLATVEWVQMYNWDDVEPLYVSWKETLCITLGMVCISY